MKSDFVEMLVHEVPSWKSHSQWHPSKSESAVWKPVSALAQSLQHLCLSFIGPQRSIVWKLLHTWPKHQSHSAFICSAKPRNTNESTLRCIITCETKVLIFCIAQQLWNTENINWLVMNTHFPSLLLYRDKIKAIPAKCFSQSGLAHELGMPCPSASEPNLQILSVAHRRQQNADPWWY